MARTKQNQRKSVKAVSRKDATQNLKKEKRDESKEPHQLFLLKFYDVNRSVVEAANPGASEEEVKALLKEMWLGSDERKAALGATEEEIEAISEMYEPEKVFLQKYRSAVKNANPTAEDNIIGDILKRMWLACDEFKMTQVKSEGGNKPDLDSEPHNVFRQKFYADNQAMVQSANPGAKKVAVNKILSKMWLSSNERKEAHTATVAEIELTKKALSESENNVKRLHHDHLCATFKNTHRPDIERTFPTASKKHINKILDRMWRKSDEKKWVESKQEVDDTLNIEADDDSDTGEIQVKLEV